MARKGGKDRGLFQRKGKPDWWVRWTCPQGHEHMEKAGPKSVARDLYQRRRVQVKAEGFCLAKAREARRREEAQRFQDVAAQYLAWSRTHRPRSLAYRETNMRQLCTVFAQQPLGKITSSAVATYLTRRQSEGPPVPSIMSAGCSVISSTWPSARDWWPTTR
jgi:hypothetical protein